MPEARESRMNLCGETSLLGLGLILVGWPVTGSLILAASLALAFLEGYLSDSPSRSRLTTKGYGL